MQAVGKSVLSVLGPLTLAQRAQMQTLIDMGIEPKVARAIAVGYAVNKAAYRRTSCGQNSAPSIGKSAVPASDVHVPAPLPGPQPKKKKKKKKVRKGQTQGELHMQAAEVHADAAATHLERAKQAVLDGDDAAFEHHIKLAKQRHTQRRDTLVRAGVAQNKAKQKVAKAGWDESEHPRADDGEFALGGGGGAPKGEGRRPRRARGDKPKAMALRQSAADMGMHFHNEINNTRALHDFTDRVARFRQQRLTQRVTKSDAEAMAYARAAYDLLTPTQAASGDDGLPPAAFPLLQANRLVAGMDMALAQGAPDADTARRRAARMLMDRPHAYDKLGSEPCVATLTGLQLDLGAGERRAPGYIGIDLGTFGDYGNAVHDLNQGLSGFPDGCAKAIRLCNSLHSILDTGTGDGNPVPLLNEVQRLLQPGGRLIYEGPEPLFEPNRDWPWPGLVLVDAAQEPGDPRPGRSAWRQQFKRVLPRVPAYPGADADFAPAPGGLPIDVAMALAAYNSAPPETAMQNLTRGAAVVAKAERVVRIAKRDEARQIVYGVVLEPDSIDSQNDTMSAEDIELAAHGFLGTSRVIGSEHGAPIEAHPVESYIAPQQLTFDGPQGRTVVKKGSWVLGVKILDPEHWARARDDGYTGFSVGGYGVREEV